MPGYISITIGPNGLLEIQNDFSLGQNIRILIGSNAKLFIGGKDVESGSGITCDSTIMCAKSICLGTDLICSWNVYITDSNWHSILKNGIKKRDTSPVTIGKHTWIGSNVFIGPGTNIGENCIISAFTKISNKTFPSRSTVGGIIPNVLSDELSWGRDL